VPVLQPFALVTLAELKEIFPVSSTGRDDAFRNAINRASRWCEEQASRRFVFRAPTVSATAIIAAITADGAQAIAGSPPAPGGTLVVYKPAALTGGTLVVTGTVGGVEGVTETFDLSLEVSAIYGVKGFTNVASATVAGRQGSGTATVGYSLAYVDYFTPDRCATELWLVDYPVQQVLAVHEDATRAYGSDTLLAEGTDFLVTGGQVSRHRGVLQRTSSATSGLAAWLSAFRAQRVIHSAGYFTVANVPQGLKSIAARLARFYFDQEQGESSQDVAQETDSMGSRTRVSRKEFMAAIREDLEEYVNHGYPVDAIRDWDQEAA
jgi:hypothetical protein